MKAKNQPPITSEIDAKEKLIVYVYEYLTHSGAKRAAQSFLEDIQYEKEIQINQVEGPGFLVNWWCVFWDLYCAAPEKRNQPEPSSEARAFHEYNMRAGMSPSCAQTSPPQQGPPFMGGGGHMMAGGPRYGPPPHASQLRGGPINMGPRMQPMGGPPPHPAQQQMGGPPIPHSSMMGTSSPRYAPHPGHMTPGSSGSGGPQVIGPDPSQSPVINRMTPNHSSSPHPQGGGGPLNGMGPMSCPPGGGNGPLGGPPGPPGMQPGGSVQQAMQQQRGVPPPQGWQPTNQFNMNSPADQQQCFMPGPPGVAPGQQNEFSGMMMNDGGMMDVKSSVNNNGPPQQDEYVMPNAYGQPGDPNESGTEIMKLKESLESSAKEYNDTDQSGFGMDFPPEAQNKW